MMFVLNGCSAPELAPVVSDSPPKIAAGGSSCKLDTWVWFPLSYVTDPPPFSPTDSADYELELATGQFSSGECLCRAASYRLEFQDIPDPEKVRVLNHELEPVPFYIDEDVDIGGILGDVVVVNDFHLLDDPLLTIYLDFIGSDEFMLRAGGLCIIDNYGGGWPITPYSSPIKDWVPNPPHAPTLDVWLPKRIGQEL